MSEPTDLLALMTVLQAVTPASGPIAWRNNVQQDRAAFVARVCVWRNLLCRTAGRRCALYFEDSVEFAAALFGAWHAQKIVYLPADTLAATCRALQSEVDVFLGEFPAGCAPMCAPDDVVPDVPEADIFAVLDGDFAGLVVYTSGSSGTPQAIPKKLSQLAAETATLETLFGSTAGQAAIVATVSHQHIYGLLFKVLWPLCAGRAIHAHGFRFFEEMMPLLVREDCILVSSPAHLKRLPDTSAWPALRLRAVFSSGGPLSFDAAHDALHRLGMVPTEVYGSSETGGIAWRRQHAVGDTGWTPLPGVDWRVEDELLQVRSPHLPDDCWFAMADRAQPEANHRFSLLGRTDRIVKLEEKRISLDAIEQALQASPLVTQARVITLQAPRMRLAAFVVLSEDGRALLAAGGKLACNRALRDVLALSVEAVAVPRRWRYLDALPVNAQGKTTQADLLALLEAVRPLMPRERLLEQQALHAVFELTAPESLFYFEGHFAGAPILPGVVQLDWVIAYGRRCFDLPPVFLGVHALKFQQVIRPEMPITLDLMYDTAKSSLNFRISSSSGQHASGRVLFGSVDNA